MDRLQKARQDTADRFVRGRVEEVHEMNVTVRLFVIAGRVAATATVLPDAYTEWTDAERAYYLTIAAAAIMLDRMDGLGRTTSEQQAASNLGASLQELVRAMSAISKGSVV